MSLSKKIRIETHVPLQDLGNLGLGTIVLVPDRKGFFDRGYYQVKRLAFECDGQGVCSKCDMREWEAEKIRAIYRPGAIVVKKGFSDSHVYSPTSEH